MARKFSEGIGYHIRDDWSGGRATPNPEHQLMGFYTGIVMDDFDDQRLGQLWVYIPGVSSRRFDENSVPRYGGTTPDREQNENAEIRFDQSLRQGWIQCRPLLPFFGADDYRVKQSAGGDQRDGQTGHVQSYGFWSQPRIGDQVGVLFAHGDPSKAFWVGCIPKFSRNFMVPGSPGRPKEDFDESRNNNQPQHKKTVEFKQSAPDDSLIPALDKARHIAKADANQEAQIEQTGSVVSDEGRNVLVSLEFATNLQEAGLLCDPLRGASTASSRRESPSYVFGFKSAGWNFDSEKNNLNTASGQRIKFRNDTAGGNESRFKDVNASGHQLVFDDHPDFQGIRLRTSAGSQLYFHDTCNEPFIYISTARGNVWIEMVDDGRINVFAEGSISLHARDDINLTADRDINIDAQRDLNIQVRRNTELKFKGETNAELGKNDLPPQGLKPEVEADWGDETPRNVKIQNFGDADWVVEGQMSLTVNNNFEFKITETANLEATVALNLKAGVSIGLEAPSIGMASSTSAFNLSSSGKSSISLGGDLHISAPNTFWQTGSFNLLCASNRQNTRPEGLSTQVPRHTAFILPPPAPTGPVVDSVDPLIGAEEATEPTITATGKKPIAPTIEEIRQCREPASEFETLIGMIVPQHQPWPERCQSSIGIGGFAEAGEVISRDGATEVNATAPLTIVTPTGVFEGVPYSTSSIAEKPQFVKIRDPEPGEFNDCTTYTTSERGIAFIKRHEGFRIKAYGDGPNWAIGYGHNITVGDTIFGDTINGRVTQEDIRQLNRTKGDLTIAPEEAERILREDLQRFEKAVCDNVTVQITQGQFDAMVSFAYNTGRRNLARMIESSGLNLGNVQDVAQVWMQYHRAPRINNPSKRRQVETVLARRRREELEQLFAAA